MIDSVLKGTGNSRFLKSAVPAGTSWADALAMLQAGTFPIDFNGINAEGFQQVGTPLNKANLLKDATAAQIGLPPSTTPDGMFQALGNTGELHVWRKTVTTAQEIPAGYTLGDTIASLKVAETFTVPRTFTVKAAASISVDDAGTITMNNPTSSEYGFEISSPESLGQQVAGKFVQFSSTGSNMEVVDGTWFFDSTASASFSNRTYYVTKAKPVNAYPLTPAGTTTTYPVSTNPNAYQEVDDAKPAGYVVGEVETGKFVLGTGVGSSKQNMFYISSSITVDDNGNISQENRGSTYINGEDNNTMQGQANNVIGKFVVLNSKQSNSDFDVGTIWYIPPDVTIRNSYSTDGEAYDQYNIINYVTKRQPVTGYAAIPAGTTIEYLGKLGDKARVQVVSYVGTGTYGANNPCSISVDFPMKAILFIAKIYVHNSVNRLESSFASTNYANDKRSIPVDRVPTVYTNYFGLGDVSQAALYGRRTEDCKSYYWYNESSPAYQGNTANSVYYFLVIG